MATLGYDRLSAAFAAETQRLGAAVTAADPSAAVPTCPEWTVRDLVTHVGTGHRWATEIVAGHHQTPPPYELAEAPQEPRAWAGWLTAGATALAATIRATGADAIVWTWRSDRTAAFWLRKMLHDEIVHRFDVDLIGGRPGDLAVDLAIDGIDDMLATAVALSALEPPHEVFGGLRGTGQTMHLRATDADVDWLVQRTPGGVTSHTSAGLADIGVSAPARDLLLVINRRIDAAHAHISGDPALLAHWLQHTAF